MGNRVIAAAGQVTGRPSAESAPMHSPWPRPAMGSGLAGCGGSGARGRICWWGICRCSVLAGTCVQRDFLEDQREHECHGQQRNQVGIDGWERLGECRRDDVPDRGSKVTEVLRCDRADLRCAEVTGP
jgi:hypothetical protein